MRVHEYVKFDYFEIAVYITYISGIRYHVYGTWK